MYMNCRLQQMTILEHFPGMYLKKEVPHEASHMLADSDWFKEVTVVMP
jgi:hypothetical protein